MFLESLIKAFRRQDVPMPDMEFDYGVLHDYFRQQLDDYTAHHLSLSANDTLFPERSLYNKECMHTLRAYFISKNEMAHDLDNKNRNLGEVIFYIPRVYRLKVEPVDPKPGQQHEGSFLDKITVSFGDAKKPFDKDEGTVTIPDSPLAANEEDGIVMSKDVLLEQIGEEEYQMTLLWLDAGRFEETIRSLRIDGRNPDSDSDADIYLDHNLCMGRNLLCGKNGGASSAGKNVIRITSEKIPSPAAEIDVQSNTEVFITVIDDQLDAYLDDRPLKYREKVPFPLRGVLNLGICSLKLL